MNLNIRFPKGMFGALKKLKIYKINASAPTNPDITQKLSKLIFMKNAEKTENQYWNNGSQNRTVNYWC